MITAGVDLGTQSVKVVILKDGEVVARGKMFSGFDPANAAEQAMNEAKRLKPRYRYRRKHVVSA